MASWALGFYNWIANATTAFIWGCPTSTVLSPFFNRYLAHSSSHLDAGSPLSLLTQSSTLPLLNKLQNLALLAPSKSATSTTSGRLAAAGYKGPSADTFVQSPLVSLPSELRGRYDTVSLFWVLHTIPGPFPMKASHVAATLLSALTPGPDSTFYGATVLGQGVRHGLLGRVLLWWLNANQTWSNAGDSADGLRKGFEPYFDEVEIEVVGSVAVFVCRGPKGQTVR